MATMLITEALQQVKIIIDRIEKEQNKVRLYVSYSDQYKDPLEKNGSNSKQFVGAALQSLTDLRSNLVKIRMAIAEKNREVLVTVEGVTRSVAEWLVWRREVAPMEQNFGNQVLAQVRLNRSTFEKEQRAANAGTPQGEAVKAANLVVVIDEAQFLETTNQISTILGTLDAKLSIVNATTSIEV